MYRENIDEYRMIYDYHTHTVFSHGKGLIEDNVKDAIQKNLKAIAITDHGPGHLTYGIKRDAIPVMRKEIDRLKPLYPNIEIYLGVEANIVANGNYLDITKEEYGLFDFVNAGYHYGIKHGYCISNWLSAHISMPKGFDKNLCIKNTDMVVKALNENDIKVLTHPGDKGPFDIGEISKACEETHTLMEISTWHDHLTVDEIKIAAKTDVEFIISSDAHVPNRVGTYLGGIERAMDAGLDLSRIVNIEKI